MQEVERSAASVEEALEAALAEIGATEQEVDVEIVREPRGGFLGVGSQEAVVRVRLKGSGEALAGAPSMAEVGEDEQGSAGEDEASKAEDGIGSEAAEEIDAELREALEDQADLVADFLDGLFEAMDLRAEVETALVEGTMYVDVWATDDDENVGLLIGRHGQALDALQELVRAVVLHRTNERCMVIVDVEDYRKRRRDQIQSRAREAATKVKKTGRAEALEPMNAYERKIVHDAIAQIGGVTSGSEGEDPARRVVIRQS
jgi:spoIIIJ-associated protein